MYDYKQVGFPMSQLSEINHVSLYKKNKKELHIKDVCDPTVIRRQILKICCVIKLSNKQEIFSK